MKVKLKVVGNNSFILNRLEDIKRKIANREMLGEIGHRTECIDLINVTHIVTGISGDENELNVDIDICVSKGYTDYNVISTHGDAVANLILSGHQLYATPRYDSQMNIITFDIMPF